MSTHLLCALVYALHNNGEQNIVYMKRNKLLLQYYSSDTFLTKKLSKNLIHIDCKCPFDYVFREICEDNPLLNSMRQSK